MRLKVHHFDVLDSTNTYARQRIQQNEMDEGEVIVADLQTHGYGRKGSPWISPEGNLYATMILNPKRHGIEGVRFSELSLVAGIAICDGLKALVAGLDLQLKWPNDVMLRGCKLAGILIEVEGDKVIVGFGVNIQEAPQGLDYSTTKLSDDNQNLPQLHDILHMILKHLWHTYQAWITDGFEGIREKWLAYAYNLGSMVERHGQKGIFKGIDTAGAMILEDEKNHVIRIYH